MAQLERQQAVLSILQSLRNPDSLKRLFWEELNYERENKPLSVRTWPDPVRSALADDPILFASGGENGAFHVVYCRLASGSLLRSLERQIVNQMIREHPYCLFVFSDNSNSSWHFLNVKYDEKAEKRRLFRRITVRSGDGLRTACERLQMLDLESIGHDLFGLPALEIQKRHDDAFDVEKVTKEFYRELANWYFWALRHIRFPKDAPKEADGHEHVSVIRLITRLVFCWFIREKGLIPDILFHEKQLTDLLEGFAPENEKDKTSVFYRAILQNLFFATLNTEMDRRGWARDEQNFMVHNLYRHKECFRKPNEALTFFKDIPFLNGGLFECLDRDLGEGSKPRYVRIDGFSRRPDCQPTVPDFLFFGNERNVDLSKDYGDNKFKRVRVRGLIDILKRYHFTIEENTPLDQDVALDPELAGNIFENLLAAYNPETGATARKQTGSFYTPREIVNYMVDEALIAFLKGDRDDAYEKKLRRLFSWEETGHDFSDEEVEVLIDKIDSLKALDPAVGSGAFPMGILHKLVFVLGKLDPDNEKWKAKQIGKLEDPVMREDAERLFRLNYDNYGRKLFLIENCIYGVDIQPIAVQIAKMRFFISLIVDQKVDDSASNRGVRALPNLETKFVAANTLIGIEKPKQMALRNPTIDAKEAELRKVREKHFNAKSLQTKEKYRQQDKKLRNEIADLLKRDGWGDQTAKQLAHWDPYDQNASADFFDPEWMFGVQDRFDVVIGNPPYGAEIPEWQLKIIKIQLKDTKNNNSAAVFIDFSKNKIIKDNGILTFIVPKSLIFSERWFSLAESLAPKTIALVDVEKAFDNVLLEQVVFVYDNNKKRNSYIAQKFIGNEFSRCIKLPVALIQKFNTWLCDVSKREIEIAEKMLSTSIPFSRISKTVRGLPLQSSLREKGEISVIGGKNIQRYLIVGTKGYFNKKDTNSIKKKSTLLLRPKIISQRLVAHIQNPSPHIQIISSVDLDGTILSVDTVENTFITNNQFDLRYLAAILNSRLISWYAYHFIFGNAIRTMDFDDYYIGKIPIASVKHEVQRPIIIIVDRIITAKNKNPKADTNTMELDIDQFVYKLYGLTEEEIAVVDGKER